MRWARKFICYRCRKEKTNPYSRRLADGTEAQFCYQCCKKEIQELTDKERLAAWNEWAER